jgi:hypothetical protein
MASLPGIAQIGLPTLDAPSAVSEAALDH